MKPEPILVVAALAWCGCGVSPLGSRPEPHRLWAEAQKRGGLLPDIVEEPPRRLSVERSDRREWLRFTSTHWNGGFGPLQLRGGGVQRCRGDEDGRQVETRCISMTQEVLNDRGAVVYRQPAGVAVFHAGHQHWHQASASDFVLRRDSLGGPVAGRATKVAHCLTDANRHRTLPTQSSKSFHRCGAELQGLSAGFGGDHGQAPEGQEIEITSLSAGTYYLTHDGDPADQWLEADEENNGAWVKFRLRRDESSGHGEVDLLEASGCSKLAANPRLGDIACGNPSNT